MFDISPIYLDRETLVNASNSLDETTWSLALDILKNNSNSLEFMNSEQRQNLRRNFFEYVESRDDRRAALITARIDVDQFLQSDQHSQKMRILAESELKQLLNLRGCFNEFSHAGCGGSSETIYYMAKLSNAVKNFVGIDIRQQSVSSANRFFAKANLQPRCKAVFEDAALYDYEQSSVVLLAAYLHPYRQKIFDRVIESSKSGTIIVLRDVTGALKEFSQQVEINPAKCHKVATISNSDLGVQSHFILNIK